MESRKLRVLVADDSEAMRRGIRTLLSESRVEIVAEAVDGADAVRKAKRYHPDVVLMDISMPTMNGFVAARLIKEALPSTRVLIVSQYHSAAFVNEALSAGAAGYVVKSEAAKDLPQLLTTIQDSAETA